MQRIGKYQVRRVLGRGGMGTVYEAVDPIINRKVAVKTMMPGLAENADLRARFLREAQAAGGLQHRNIVTVYDLGDDRGQPFIAMEFIEGTDLERVIQSKEPLTVEWKLDVLRQVCEGLGYAHRHGIVHRDVKPANIRVTAGGEVKIMDFGIAHLQSSTMTRSGLVLGTVHYMSPEQIEGLKVDHRADIFSVGAIAYELLAYKKPFDGDSLTAVMFRIMNERPDPKPLTTPYSPALENVVMKALERDAEKRYQGLDDMELDLVTILREAQVRTPERPAWGRPRDERSAKAARLVEEGQELLAQGRPDAALEKAREALQVTPTDVSVRELLRIAEGEVTARRVEGEIREIRAEMERAWRDGQLQKALAFCRRLLELTPADKAIAQIGSEIEIAIKDREVEQLCSLALAYAADGDTELAQKIALRIERLSPRNPRFLQLRAFLEEEQRKNQADAIVALAREHLAEGNLVAAHATAEEALKIHEGHALAREIRDRTESVLMKAAGAIDEPTPPLHVASPSPPPPSRVEPAPAPSSPVERAPEAAAVEVKAPGSPQAPTVQPNGAPVPAPFSSSPDPPALAPAALAEPLAAPPPEGDMPKLPGPPPAQAPPAAPLTAAATRLAPAATLTPTPEARGEGELRRAEVERLTTVALNAFVVNDYPKARKAAEKALGLDPANKKARELMKILGALG